MNANKKLTNYVSDLDQFLTEFDKTHELSAVQRRERDKFKRVYALRDNANRSSDPKKKLFEDF